MKRFILFIFFVFAGTSLFSQNSKLFKELEDYKQKKGYEWRYEEGAKIFEKIYLKHSKKKKFKTQLFKFLGHDSDKMYWIGIFLKDNDSYYTKLKDYDLAIEVLVKGLELEAENQREQIRFLFIIGKHYYFKNEKEKSLEFLIPAYHIAKQYPGNTPTWDSSEQAEEIYEFIELNML